MMIDTRHTINMAYNALTSTNKALERTARALSTGLKAAVSADDASGVAIGTSKSAQALGVDRAIRNSQDGVSLLQTAEGGLNQINSMLQRMRELSMQAANDTLTTQDRGYLQLEIAELRKNIDSVANTTTFNSKRLLDGSSSAIWSSSDATTKLKVTGALTEIDPFGQRKPIEGNFRIEIKAQAGQAEVQKTSIFDLTVAEEYMEEEEYIDDDGETATVDVKKVRIREATLADLSQFYDPSSRFMLTEPQTITITQGDSRTASFTLYSSDTISDAAKKINDAIADGLGQAQYTDNRENFCTVADGTPNTSESVRSDTEAVYQPSYQRNDEGELEPDNFGKPVMLSEEGELVGYTERGTLLIRSAIAGESGRLKFSAESNDLINALGLSTIQEASENVFTASVYDAHSGSVIASSMECEGNVLVGALGPNASVEFDPMANVKSSWDETSKRYVLSSEDNTYVTTIHVSDRSTSFQIGQGEGEDIYISIGDMRSASLGLDRVDVLTRKSAASSITLLDAAIHKVGIQRSRVGSYQNELEYNANSLQQTGLHLQESESRITDADMATEYMEFVKFQILNQTGSSMLAQASQNAQSIMSVLAQ